MRDQEQVLGLHVPVSDRLQVQVIETQHHLIDNISSYLLGKAVHLCKPLEQLSSFHQLADHVVVLIVLNQVHYSDDIRMRFRAQDGKLILQKLDVDLMLLHCPLGHDLDSEGLPAVFVHAQPDQAKGPLAKSLAKHVSSFDVLEPFECFVCFHSYCVFACEVWGTALGGLGSVLDVVLGFDAFD